MSYIFVPVWILPKTFWLYATVLKQDTTQIYPDVLVALGLRHSQPMCLLVQYDEHCLKHVCYHSVEASLLINEMKFVMHQDYRYMFG